MNIKKILDSITKEYIEHLIKDKPLKIAYGHYKDQILIVENFRAFLIDSKLFPFDLEKILLKRDLINAGNIIPRPDYYEAATATGDKKYIKSNVIKIANTKKVTWVDEKLLKEFGTDINFKIAADEKAFIRPVLVYKGDNLLGLVLPVRMSEEDYRV